jgi:hypothetical protein
VGIIAPGRKDIGIKTNAESAFYPTINRPTGCLLVFELNRIPKIFLIATAISRKLKQETKSIPEKLRKQHHEIKNCCFTSRCFNPVDRCSS